MKDRIIEKQDELTINKIIVECYKLRHYEWWADITIDAKDTTGRIQIASDYGSWQYYWGSCGSTFKKFLAGLDKHYVAGKFGADKFFDNEKTVAEYRRVIKENINDGYLKKKTGISALGELQCLEESSCKEEFCRNLQDCSEIMRLYDHCPSLIYSIDPLFDRFWHEIWPILLREFEKEELESLKQQAGEDK